VLLLVYVAEFFFFFSPPNPHEFELIGTSNWIASGEYITSWYRIRNDYTPSSVRCNPQNQYGIAMECITLLGYIINPGFFRQTHNC
jgi:hypothetical protein